MIEQLRHGYLSIGGTQYKVNGWGNASPKNLVQGMPLGNTWSSHFAPGARSSRIGIDFEVRETASEVLSTAFWDLFLTRTWGSGIDQTSATTIVAADGKRTRTFANAKAESFVLSVAFGAVVGLRAVFVAPGGPTVASYTPADYSKTADTSPPLMFDKVTFGGITGDTFGAELSYSNNHQVDAPLTGSKSVRSFDAGPITASLRLSTKDSEPFSDAGTVTIALVGAATRTLSCTACSLENPDDFEAQGLGPAIRSVMAIVQGSATVPPVTYT